MKKLIIFAVVVCLAAFLGSGMGPETTVSQDAQPSQSEYWMDIPASAFVSYEDGYDFIRHRMLFSKSGVQSYYAPVILPHGTIIKKILLVCKDGSDSLDVSLYLSRAKQDNTSNLIIQVKSTGSDANNFRTFHKMLTVKKYVNTWKYSYFLLVHLPGPDTNSIMFGHAKLLVSVP